MTDEKRKPGRPRKFATPEEWRAHRARYMKEFRRKARERRRMEYDRSGN